MSGRIPDTFIDELLTRADIVEVIGARVALKRAGSNYKGLCPFHGEKTASFTVSPSKGFYHCFGCGAHGTVIRFLMNYENLGFPEAIEELADMLGLEVPRQHDAQRPRAENDGLFTVLREADQVYRTALRDAPDAIRYLKNRGIDGATAGRFTMGFAPDAWDTLLRALGTSEDRVRHLLQAGLVVENEQGRRYDRFRNRIVFPIRDARGRVIGFGGRVLDSGEPKYLNSPETPVFHKGQALYGLYEARQQHGRPQEVLVVEGYLDVASLAQHGIEPVVATLGTATTADHIRRLTRLSDRVVFCFDGDRAGRAAAWKAMETALPYGGGTVELKFLLLPEAEDPDSFVRAQGAEAFRDLVRHALPLSTFMLGELRNRSELDNADGRSRLVTLTRPLLERLPDGAYRALILQQLAQMIGMPAEGLERLVGAPRAQPARPPAAPDAKATRIRKTIGLVLHYPSAAAQVDADGLEAVEQPGAPLLRALLEIAQRNPQITSAHLVERFADHPEGRYLDRLVTQVPLDDEAAAPVILADSIRLIVEKDRQKRAADALKSPRPPAGG
jgi:DNA primase